MSNHQDHEVSITVPEVVTEDGVTLYQVVVEVGPVIYRVKHRYSEFESVHSKIVEDGVEKDLLPPKKLIGNKDPAFIMKRRKDLETYLQTVYHFLEKSLPRVLAEFLDFPTYDIHYVLQDLASHYHETDLRASQADSEDGPSSSLRTEDSSWTPLQLHSISERLKSPWPPMNTEDKRLDFTNVADACCKLETLRVVGSTENIGSSQLIPNQLKFDFLAFKSLRELELTQLSISPEVVSSLGILRSTLSSLTATHCGLETISQLLLCDLTHSQQDLTLDFVKGGSHCWVQLLSLNISDNQIQYIDNSIRFAPKLESLNVSSNLIEEITNLTGLPHLRSIDFNNNKIKDVESLHTKVGQIHSLDLSQNMIRNLHGMSRLYSVTNLDVANNKLRTLADVSTVAQLPCIEKLQISPNKVNNEVDYRLKVLEGYGGRCGEVRLDDLETSQAEMDKVSVLMALRVAREGKSPTGAHGLFGNLPRGQQDL